MLISGTDMVLGRLLTLWARIWCSGQPHPTRWWYSRWQVCCKPLLCILFRFSDKIAVVVYTVESLCLFTLSTGQLTCKAQYTLDLYNVRTMAVQNSEMSIQNCVCTAVCPDTPRFLFRPLDSYNPSFNQLIASMCMLQCKLLCRHWLLWVEFSWLPSQNYKN